MISVTLGLLLFLIIELFNIGSTSISAVGGIIGAAIIGQMYVYTFREVMPRKLRFKVAMIYILAQIAISSLYILTLDVSDYSLFFIILILFNLVYLTVINFMLGINGQIYLWAIERGER